MHNSCSITIFYFLTQKVKRIQISVWSWWRNHYRDFQRTTLCLLCDRLKDVRSVRSVIFGKLHIVGKLYINMRIRTRLTNTAFPFKNPPEEGDVPKLLGTLWCLLTLHYMHTHIHTPVKHSQQILPLCLTERNKEQQMRVLCHVCKYHFQSD